MRNKALLTCMVLFAQLLLGGPFRALAADVGPRVPQGLHFNLGNLSQLDNETSQTVGQGTRWSPQRTENPLLESSGVSMRVR